MPLTSQIKKLEGFSQKLIKYEPGLIPVNNDEKHLLRCPDSLEKGAGLGATKQRKQICSFTRSRKMRKKAVLNSV
jgi:hypothetical protein